MRLLSLSTGSPHMWEVRFLAAAFRQRVTLDEVGTSTGEDILRVSLMVQDDLMQIVATLLNLVSAQMQAPSVVGQVDWPSADVKQVCWWDTSAGCLYRLGGRHQARTAQPGSAA
jgi:hypothetical protein